MTERELVAPPALRTRDRVGVVAPSFPTASQLPERFHQSVLALETSLDVTAELAPHVLNGHDYRSAPASQRAEEFQRFISDPEIRAVFATIGGYNSAEILPLLDVEVLRANPTIVVGYSDVSALLLGLHALAGWHTFHGPTLMTDLGEMPAPDPFTVSHLRQALGMDHTVDRVVLNDPPTWTNEFLDWATDAWRRGRAPAGVGHRSVWREGAGTGRLFGGNVDTVNFLVGTPYLQPPEDIVLLVEASGGHADLPQLQRSLVHLDQAGLLSRTRALLVGRSPDARPVGERTLRDVVVEVAAAYDFPIVANLPFGHTSPIWTLPIGLAVTVEAVGGEAMIALNGCAVR